MLLDDYWERMNLKVPIYFSAGMPMLLHFMMNFNSPDS